MLNWDDMMPTNTPEEITEAGTNCPDPGEISPCGGNAMSCQGKYIASNGGASGEISPISPISHEKISGVEIRASEGQTAGGGGGQDQFSAREVRGFGLITCDQCANYWHEGGVCRIAKPERGALVVAERGYRPIKVPQRCRGFQVREVHFVAKHASE